MNAVESFAAARRDRMKDADGELGPLVVSALSAWSDGNSWFNELVTAASVLWLEIFEREAPDLAPEQYLAQFQESLAAALEKTEEPDDPPAPGQVHRVTYWLSTYTVNNATYHANRAAGRPMRWATMRDGSVRDTHRAANGQIADADGTFDIGGFDLRYPGEPVGPPEIWINCRCILVPGRVEGALDVAEPIIASGFIVQVEAEGADVTYGPFDTEENARRWLESDGGPFDGEFQIVPLMDPDGDDEAPADEEKPATPPANFALASDDPDDPLPDDGDDELPMDEEEDDEELITEIPVHGVTTIEGRPTGDGRHFLRDSVTFGQLPQPLGFEFESSHGGDNSRVAIIGRIDEYWKVDNGEYVEVRWRGVIHPNKPYASQAIEGIIDGSYGGLSIIGDDISVDIESSTVNAESAPDGTQPVVDVNRVRIRRHDMVPTPAYQEAYIALGAEFPDELDPEELEALKACGCQDGEIIDLSGDALENFRAAAEAEDGAYRTFTADERKKMAEEGTALPDGSFPIANEDDLRNAIQAIGRASDPDEARAHIKKRAKALGKEDLIPDDWALVAAISKPGTKDGPGWITHPVPTARIRRYWVRGPGAAKIRWGVPGDFNRCRKQLLKYIANPEWLAGACANMHKEALGIWPGQESGKRAHSTEGVAMSLTAAGPSVKPAAAFRIPEPKVPTPLTIEEDGTIYGHLAVWGVCHIGIQDVCTVAPHSSTNYAFFRTGTVVTDEGRIAVGQITMGTGHAGLRANSKDAVAHYDHTGTAVADIVAIDGNVGVWTCGMVRPGATQEQIDALQAAALSGDWRRTANGLELVAALAVNVPGFPIPRTSLAASADTGQESLVAAGVVTRDPALTAGLLPSVDEIAGIVRTTIEEFRYQEQREARIASLEPFAEEVRQHARAQMEAAAHAVNDYFRED